MERLLNTPLLPKGKVTAVALGAEYLEYGKILQEKHNISTINIEPDKLLESSIASHADCILLQLNENTLVINKGYYETFVKYLTSYCREDISNLNLLKTEKNVSTPYPNDVLLNAKIIGNKIICNPKYIDKQVKNLALSNGLTFLHTNQGYAACSTVVLNSNALITDDESVFNVSVKNGIDSLKVSKGSVKLNGHDYGFIGGTCGMINENVLAFTGKLENHSDYKEILNFLNKHNVRHIELTDGALTDIGGIIPLFEEY